LKSIRSIENGFDKDKRTDSIFQKMPVLTRSNTGPRRSRSLSKRKLDIENESECDLTEDETESEYEPPSESETLSEDSEDETATVESYDAETLQERIEFLRAELALAEIKIKKLHEAYEAEIRANNNTFLPMILALTVSWGIYTWMEWSVIGGRKY
jgi:hypothetical protein